MLLPLGGLAAGLWLLSRRRPRACASPVGEEALWLGGCALLAALGHGELGGAWALGGGLVSAPVLVGLLATSVWALWGRRGHLVRMRQPWFRVLADNPATLTLVAKVRLREEPLVVDLPRCADGPVSAVLYDLRLRQVTQVPWEVLREDYEAGRGRAVLTAEPGRYLLSVRLYRPWERP